MKLINNNDTHRLIMQYPVRYRYPYPYQHRLRQELSTGIATWGHAPSRDDEWQLP